MQPLVIVIGGKNANIRKQDGRLIRATMSRFVGRVIVGGNKTPGHSPAISSNAKSLAPSILANMQIKPSGTVPLLQ